MTDIIINRCRLRVVRRNGWAWGADPQLLLNNIMRILPELIARRLAGMFPEDTELEITAPVRISVPVRISELMRINTENINDAASRGNAGASSFDARLTHALETELERVYDPPAESSNGKDSEKAEVEAAKLEVQADSRGAGAVWRLLMEWSKQGVLEDRIHTYSLRSLEAWHRSLFKAHEYNAADQTTVSAEKIAGSVNRIAVRFPRSAVDRASILRRRMMVAVEVSIELELMPSDSFLQAEVDRLFPLEEVAAGKSATIKNIVAFRSDSDEIEPRIAKLPPFEISESETELKPSPPRQIRDAGLHIRSALPFLLLGPLSRIGYLKALAANMEAAALVHELPYFASALAYKVLEPPERGWRRDAIAVDTATIFAGLTEPVSEPDLVRFAEAVLEHLSPLDAVLTGALIDGHDPDRPMLLQRADSNEISGLLLLDTEGLFPIAWESGAEELFPFLEKYKSAHLLIPRAIAKPRLLDQIDTAGFRFITDAPPTRHETWRPLRQSPTGRWWTNDRSSPESKLFQSAGYLEESAEEAEVLWQTLSTERPSVPLDNYPVLDRHLTISAATALGTIAWTLWHERESTVPQLALERFYDLDAIVRYSSESVTVRVPMGRRFEDLRNNHLLDDIEDVPWLDGRVLKFSGG